jgi:hypothetical protein
MEIRFFDVAQQELDETVDYYLEVLSSLERIKQFPEACIRSLKIAADAKLAAFLMASPTKFWNLKYSSLH